MKNKKKVGKMAIFEAKPLFNPFGKLSIFRLFKLLVFIAQKAVFLVLEYHFSVPYCIKKAGKMAIFGPQPWVKAFAIMSIFRLFELLVFKAQKSCFFDLEYRKTHVTGLYCLKKKFAKMTIFRPKPWVNSFLKISILRTF